MIEKININKVFSNPVNPRLIKDFKFKKLLNSIKEFPEMLKLRPIIVNSEYGILGGNMRYKACKELGIKDIWIIKADNLTDQQKEQFVIKDNLSFGEWDWEILANEWDAQILDDWGLPIRFGENDFFDVDEQQKIENNKPSLRDDNYSAFECIMLHDNKLRLIEGINKAKTKFNLDKTEDALIAIINKFLSND